MIPNHIHFVFFGFTEFTMLHYLSVKSALSVHKPDRVSLYYSQAPKNNPLWNQIAKLVDLVKVEPPTEINGVPLTSYQYKADIVRLEKLIEHGGIYLDIDVISLKPFGKLLENPCVVGIESSSDLDSMDLSLARSVTNAVLMCDPQHEFIKDWLKQTADNLVGKPWAFHGVCLPLELLRTGDYEDVAVEPARSFMPFDFRTRYIFDQGPEAAEQLANSYTMHMWETIWKDDLKNIDSEYLDREQNLFAHICKRYYVYKPKIAIYTICKNEQHQVQDWTDSNVEADYRLVCDTGSTDQTVENLRKHGVVVVPITVSPWRFDVARGTSLNLLPADVDICIWQDLDERLLPGWRQQIEQNWKPNTTLANHKYRNNNNPWQWHSKIHARHGCIWQGAVHETLAWHVPESTIWLHELYLDEHQDLTKNRRGYFDLLLQKVAEGDHYWKTYYFLANEYGNQNRQQESIDTRIKSYNACQDGDSVKSYIARNIARGFHSVGNNGQADQWFRISTDHANERESWFAYAEFCHSQLDWERCYMFAKRCLAVEERRNGFTQEPRAWSAAVYDTAALAAYHVGLYQQAITYGQQALDHNPEDQRLQRNMQFYQEALAC